jgi:hypothetical protein
MECDSALQPDYPHLYSAPSFCNLGLDLSYYDVQPLPGQQLATLGLRALNWTGWGTSEATAHGLACDLLDTGGTDWSVCTHVTVSVYRPQSIGPAGGAVIYQRTRVKHNWGGGYNQFTYWYQPGTDY